MRNTTIYCFPAPFLRTYPAAAMAALFWVLAPAPRLLAQSTATVTVNAATPLSIIQPQAFGLNTAAWDAYLLDEAVPPLLKQVDISALRFPGGAVTDVYHWQTSTASNGQYVNPNNTFDAFMGVAQKSGSEAIICVNYGTNMAGNAGGDPTEAAAWVDYANNAKKYGIKYWEVGNEVYGNGEYGVTFETDLHSDHSPTTYGKNVALYVAAMKAKDPTIKVGVVLISPGQFPDGQTPDWNSGVLSECGSVIDFVIVHSYPQEPGSESDSFLLSAPRQIAGVASKLRALIQQHCGANAANVQILVTEMNSVTYNPGKQSVGLVNALFIIDEYSTWLENGAANVDMWTLHNSPLTGNNNSSSLYGSATYGDYGMLATGDSPEPPTDTPLPDYDALRLLSYFAHPTDYFVATASSQSLLTTHAVVQANGKLALLLINKDPVNSFATTITVEGFAPDTVSTDYFYGKPSSEVTSSASTAGSSFGRTLPPYSATTVVMQPAATTPVATPTPGPTPVVQPTPTPTPAPTPTPSPAPGAALPTVNLTADVARAYPARGVAAKFLLTRSGGDLTQPLTILLKAAGNAEPGTDYQALSLSKKFKAGRTSKRITIQAVDETAAAPGTKKTVKLSLQPDGAYQLGASSTAKVRIVYRP